MSGDNQVGVASHILFHRAGNPPLPSKNKQTNKTNKQTNKQTNKNHPSLPISSLHACTVYM